MWHFCPRGIVIEPHRVTVVSTREVVRLAGVIVAVAFAWKSVPDGSPLPLSVSIRIHKSTLGESTFARLSLSVVPATQLPKTGREIRVLPATSLIFCAVVACAVVGLVSVKTVFPTDIDSQAG